MTRGGFKVVDQVQGQGGPLNLTGGAPQEVPLG